MKGETVYADQLACSRYKLLCGLGGRSLIFKPTSKWFRRQEFYFETNFQLVQTAAVLFGKPTSNYSSAVRSFILKPTSNWLRQTEFYLETIQTNFQLGQVAGVLFGTQLQIGSGCRSFAWKPLYAWSRPQEFCLETTIQMVLSSFWVDYVNCL